ncbi:hypothetical protein EDD16DRAFT_1686779 [Pisolithus croceorrhizus]|nr:hypothetical protein EDD16DRAFT_1686779 [Pisolithus croceorrhizus]
MYVTFEFINNIRIRFLLVGLRVSFFSFFFFLSPTVNMSGSFFFGLCTVYPYVGLILFLSLPPPPPSAIL